MVAHDIPASVVVTASHNPPEYTGFKFAKEGALAMSRKGGMAEIEEVYESGEFEEGEGDFKRIDLGNGYVGFVRNKIKRLKYETEKFVSVTGCDGFVEILYWNTIEGVATFVSFIKHPKNIKQCRFSRTRRSHYGNQLPFGYVEIDPFQHMKGIFAHPVGLVQVFYFDHDLM
jgi:hypothetical protein